MRFPFVTRSHDVEQLRATLPHLGPSSTVAGVAAALTWNERRVERAVREWERVEPMRVAFDPLSRSIRLLGARLPTAHPPPAPAAASMDRPSAPVASAPTPASPTPKSWAAPVNCRSCGSLMEPTGTGTGLFCPNCGRLASLPPAAGPHSAPAGPPGSSPAGPTAPGVSTGTGHAVSDRKAQEMFAAWATARPIPCPRCRSPLRHDGVGKYRCAGCGETVRFSGENGIRPEPAPALAPPAT
ncbi:MAG TPA: hypothetical protein VJQ43_03195 [Thermoplasmata archaeon]|nr:hypothetical protein [Thermoplasmata archaeon]